jgi:hypothetical protein
MFRQSVGFLPIPVGHGMMFAVQGCPFDAFNYKTFGLYFEEGTVKMGAPAVAARRPRLQPSRRNSTRRSPRVPTASTCKSLPRPRRSTSPSSTSYCNRLHSQGGPGGRAPHC